MRNLIQLNRGNIQLESITAPDLPVAASSFDPITDSITVVLGPGEFHAYEVQQLNKDGSIIPLTNFEHDSELVGFIHFSDLMQLVFVFQNGDLINASYDGDEPVIERVGQIYCEIDCAQWSHDEETLILVTRQKTVILFNRSFECLNDVELSAEDSELSNHIDVGWGSKETQFRGRGARQLERDLVKNLDLERDLNKRDPTMPMFVDKGTLSPMDDKKPHVTWRKDCEYFAVSTIDMINGVQRRMIRVFTKEGSLENVSEPVDFQEGLISWGNLITSVQRKNYNNEDDSLDIIFLEKNGLRHGEFDSRLALDDKIDSITWNSNNEVFAIQSGNDVTIWATKNYHWYLKQKISTMRLQFIKWHPEKPLTLMLGTSNTLEIVDFGYKTTTGPSIAPLDIGMNLVVDGATLNITPLAMANVPPPMSYRELDLPGTILDAAVDSTNEKYAVLTNDSVYISVGDLSNLRKGKHPKIVSTVPKEELGGGLLRQVCFVDGIVAVLIDLDGLSRIVLVDVTDLEQPFVTSTIESEMKVILMKPIAEWSKVSYETINGGIHIIKKSYVDEIQGQDYISVEITTFPQLCSDYEITVIKSDIEREELCERNEQKQQDYMAFGLASSGKLFQNNLQLSSGITSLKITESHLIITTAQHTLRFIHLNSSEFKPLMESTDVRNDERIRSIERGSLLVNVIPSKSAVVLQAPRGNLETLNPRIMVLSGVRKDIKHKNYKSAFVTCRTHRIDLDILHDYDPELFLSNVELFVKQIERVDFLDLFVSCLHEEDVTITKYRETNYDSQLDEQSKRQQSVSSKLHSADPNNSKINKICEAILQLLLTPSYKNRYLQTIVTAYACENPANLESALKLINTIEDPQQAEKCVVHLCFLQDVNLLYKVALGIYDIKLTLAIAQQSQMDPKEYLPFLQNLFEQSELRRRFLIDTYLKKYERAIGHLAEIHKNEALTEEFKDYVVEHDLYKTALGIFKYDSEKQNVILSLCAKNLLWRQEYAEAGITYELLGDLENALEAYILAQKWKEALSLTENPQFKDQLEDTAERLISALTDAHKYSDAARIQQRLGNIDEAVSLYCKEYFYEDAILLANLESKIELINDVVDPALGDGFGTIAELIADCKGQLQSQLRRLRELRDKKAQDPYAFFGQIEDSDAADNVSVAPSETSTKDSFFTRYTGKTSGTAKTGASRRTHKNKRREERKRARGKKGTIYEEEYLVQSVGRMIERLDVTKPEAARLIEGLLRRGKREQAYQIQKNFVDLLEELKQNIIEIYDISEKDRERIDENGEVYYVPEIPIPIITDFAKKNILDY
jgi:elongator complex protein 1